MIGGLSDKAVESIRNVFFSFPKVDKVILYGSRAMGNYQSGSDIDLAIMGDDLTLNDLNSISLKLDELLLPYTFDLSIFHYINNDNLIDHIKRVGIVFFSK